MAIEIEKKYRLTRRQRDSILSRLPKIGANLQGTDFEENTLYRGDMLELGRCILRLRRVGGRAVLTYKERFPSLSAIKHQREDETVVEDPDALESILDALGLTPAVIYEKRRQIWRLNDAEITIDELPFGLFMEIEGQVDVIKEVERLLDIKGLRSEMGTYPQLAFEHGKKRGDLVEARFKK